MIIQNINQLEDDAYSKNIIETRLNALFLTKVFKDNDTMRHLIHKESKILEPIMQSFLDYYEHKDMSTLLKDIEAKTTTEEGFQIPYTNCFFAIYDTDNQKYENNPFFIKDEEGYYTYLKDLSSDSSFVKPSNWTNLDLYNQEFSHNITDTIYHTKPCKSFIKAKPIDIMKETMSLIDCTHEKVPHTDNNQLNLILKNLHQNQDVNEQLFTSALKIANNTLVSYYNGKEELTLDKIKTITFLTKKSSTLFDSIDYKKQREFYKSETCQELAKLSYLTTFNKLGEFREDDMNDYIKSIKESGSWILAHSIITDKISQSSNDYIGLNGNLIELATIKPLENNLNLPILRKYHKEDSNYIANCYLPLDKKIFRQRMMTVKVDELINVLGKSKDIVSEEGQESIAEISFKKAFSAFLYAPEINKDKTISEILMHKSTENDFIVDDQVIDLFNKLSSLKRKGWVDRKVEQPESVAEHSFGLAYLALKLTPLQLNREKSVRMALVHDIQEAYVGDFTPHDKITPEEKTKLELAAAKQISKELNCPEYLHLFLEYEKGNTLEALFVKDLDRMEAVLQAKYYDNNHRVPEALIPEFLPYAKKKYQGGYNSNIVLDIYKNLEQRTNNLQINTIKLNKSR